MASTYTADTDDAFIDDITIPAADDFPLAATVFIPRTNRRGAVLINSATAVPQKIYRRFASYLAGRGFVVLTYDYRGVGGSRPKSLVGFNASMADWAAKDITGAVAWMRQRYGEWPLRYVGHSFGGQALGLLPNNAEVAKTLLVAAQAGYWRLMTPPENYRVFVFLNCVARPLTRALGYMPGRMGIGEDLPKGVMLQWASWVLSNRYLLDDPSLTTLSHFPNYRGAMRALTFTDDPWATPPAVELLCSFYSGARPEMVKIAPKDIGARKIGHLGFFKPEFRDTLWEDAADWLEVE
ncbi:MAG TPA: alpha/beta fold hydrolase [Xanthobacteraceae bacterium]|nr:alpha/beta fold hydrolase [Xanthobacteraceae bacterium]